MTSGRMLSNSAFFRPVLTRGSIYHSSCSSSCSFFFGLSKQADYQADYSAERTSKDSSSEKKRDKRETSKETRRQYQSRSKDKSTDESRAKSETDSKKTEKDSPDKPRSKSKDKGTWLQEFLAGRKTPLPPQAYLPPILSALVNLGLSRYSAMPRRLPSGLFYSFHDPQYRYVYGTGHDFYRPGAPLPEIEGAGRLFSIGVPSFHPKDRLLELLDPSTHYNVLDLKDALVQLRKKLEETPEQSHLPLHLILSTHGWPGYLLGSPSIAHFARDFREVFPDPNKLNIGSFSTDACFAGTCLDDLRALEKDDPEIARALTYAFGPYLDDAAEHPFAVLSREYGFPIYTNRANYGFSLGNWVQYKPTDRGFSPGLQDQEALQKLFGPKIGQEVEQWLRDAEKANMSTAAIASYSVYEGQPTLRIFTPSGDKVFHSDREISEFLGKVIAPNIIGIGTGGEPVNVYQYPMNTLSSWINFPYTVSDWSRLLGSVQRRGSYLSPFPQISSDPEDAPWYSPGRIGRFTHSYHPYFSTSALVAAPLVASAFKDPKSRVAASALTSAALSLPSLYSLALQSAAFSAKSIGNVLTGSPAGTPGAIASGALKELGPMAFFALSPLVASTLMLYLSGDLQKVLKSRSKKTRSSSESHTTSSAHSSQSLPESKETSSFDRPDQLREELFSKDRSDLSKKPRDFEVSNRSQSSEKVLVHELV
ncbi:MAG: hypothetical protein QW299_08590 [Candidatus Caldarchaeum sp.]